MTSNKCEKIFQISIKYSKSRTRCIKSDLVRHVFTFFSCGYLRRSTVRFVPFDREKSSLSSAIESAIPSEAILRKIFDFAREGLNNAKKYRAAEMVLCAVRVVERKGKREGREREREEEKSNNEPHTLPPPPPPPTFSFILSTLLSRTRARTHNAYTTQLFLSTPYLYIYLSLRSFFSK